MRITDLADAKNKQTPENFFFFSFSKGLIITIFTVSKPLLQRHFFLENFFISGKKIFKRLSSNDHKSNPTQ